MTLLEVLLVAAAALAAAYLLTLAVAVSVWPLQRVTSRARGAFSAPFVDVRGRANDDHRLNAIDREVRRRIGLGAEDESEDGDVVAAAVAAQGITVLNQMLRQSITTCLKTHWAIARMLDPTADMGIAARHMASRRSRQRVIDLTTTLAARIDHYPLFAPELLTLRFGVKQLGVMCAVCPYFVATVATAPSICPTAEAISTKTRRASTTSDSIDGVVIEVCDEDQH